MKVELTSLFGMDVYTDKGKYVGKVNDVVIDPVERRIAGLALINVNPEIYDTNNKGLIIPYRLVLAVGDIILMKEIRVAREKEKI